jgi:DNA repair protein RadA/Sms
VGGEPGIGKSTLLIQSAMMMAEGGARVLYATGEESLQQVAGRAARVGAPPSGLSLLPSSDLACIESHLEAGGYEVLVVDSIQTMHSGELSSPSGSVSQVRHCAAGLASRAKPSGTTVFMVGHVTKDGSMAGPKVLEHLVDAVISFQGDSFHQYRLLRGVKNRFGSTSELGVFEMKANGLTEVKDSAGYFLEGKDDTVTGSAVAAVLEGSRPFLVEVQALAITSGYGFPQRRANGFDSARLAMLLAVLERRCGLQLGNQDVYVNVVGGFSISDPGADLAVCIAIASSLLDRPVIPATVMGGEVGLSGEIRPVAGLDRRIAEAVNLGFARMASARARKNGNPEALIEFDTVSSAVYGLLREKGGEWLT